MVGSGSIIFCFCRNSNGIRINHLRDCEISKIVQEIYLWCCLIEINIKSTTKQMFIIKKSYPKSLAIFGREWIHLGCFAGWWQSINLTQRRFSSFLQPSYPGITATLSILMCTAHWIKVKQMQPVWICILPGKHYLKTHSGEKSNRFFSTSHPGTTATHRLNLSWLLEIDLLVTQVPFGSSATAIGECFFMWSFACNLIPHSLHFPFLSWYQ